MSQRTVLSTFLAMLLVMVLSGMAGAQPTAGLVGYWPLDDEGTGTAPDHSGNGRHGTLINQATFVSDSVVGGAMYFDGTNDRVEITGWTGILGGQARTISAWVKTDATSRTDMTIVGWGPDSGTAARMDFRLFEGRLRCEHRSGNIQANTRVDDGEWHHVAVVIQQNASISYGDVLLYRDGVDDTRSTTDADVFNTVAGPSVTIGIRPDNNGRDWWGSIDEVRIYDRALTAQEIKELAAWPRSYAPSPADNSAHEQEYAILSWLPGKDAAQFDVYLSHNRNDVDLRAPAAKLPRQNADFLYLTSLDLGSYYYWRVDDVEADGVTLHEGPVWSFLVPEKTAYWPDPIDGRDLIDPCNVTLSWNRGMKAILHELYLGESFDDVNNGTGDTNKGVVASTSFTVTETLKPETTYYWRVDETEDTLLKHKGPIWSFTTMPVFPVTDPNLVCWWPLEENDPFTVLDHSGHGNHGALVDTPQWVEGFDGLALEFGPNDDRDGVRADIPTVIYPEYTMTLWTKASIVGQDQYSSVWSSHTPNSAGIQLDTDGTSPGRWRLNPPGGTAYFGRVTTDWVHLAIAVEGTTAYFYYNGWWAYTEILTDTNVTWNKFAIGENRNLNNGYEGIIDDFRVYDKRLTQDEIKQVMRIDPKLAWDPIPARSSVPDIREATELSWRPGDLATQHDVYFGTSQRAVANANTSSPEYRGRRGGTTYPLGGLVEFAGGPYYWRVDEVNSDSTITKGRVWNFSVADFFLIDDIEDYNNYSPDTVWETWIDGWGNASNGSMIGHPDPNFAGGESYVETGIVHGGDQSMPYYYDNNLKYSEATMTLVGDKRNWAETGINTLSIWHYGYPVSDASLTEGPAGTYTMVSSGADIYGTDDRFTFAWKVLSGEGSITARLDSIEYVVGGSRAGVMIRDSLDADSINAIMMLRADGGLRFNRRTDTGATTGGDTPAGTYLTPQWLRIERDFAGMVTAYHANDVGGAPDSWAMVNTVNIQMDTPMYIGLAMCSNSAGTPATAALSHVTITGASGPFTCQDIGIQSNEPERMFVSVKDAGGQVATKYHDDDEAALATSWTEWNITLAEFLADNASLNLGNIDTISIGFGTPGNNQPAGSGIVFFDDIRLYGSRCFPDIVKPALDFSRNCVVDMADLEIMTDNWLISDYEVTPVAPSNAGLVAHYQFENNLLDSSGNGYSGDPCGTTVGYAAGRIGQALNLDGSAYVNVGNIGIDANDPRTIAGWAKASVLAEDIAAWTNVFGFSGPSGGSQHFDIQRRGGGVDYYCIHIHGWQQNILPMDQDWHHLAATYDGATISWYGDGHKAGSEDQYLVTTGTFQIGKRVDNSNEWPGLVDDVRVYDRALTQEEIGSLAGKTATYRQDVGMLTTIQDGNIDVNADGAIDFQDYAGLLQSWLDEQLWP